MASASRFAELCPPAMTVKLAHPVPMHSQDHCPIGRPVQIHAQLANIRLGESLNKQPSRSSSLLSCLERDNEAQLICTCATQSECTERGSNTNKYSFQEPDSSICEREVPESSAKNIQRC